MSEHDKSKLEPWANLDILTAERDDLRTQLADQHTEACHIEHGLVEKIANLTAELDRYRVDLQRLRGGSHAERKPINDPNPTAQPESNPGVVSSEIVSRRLTRERLTEIEHRLGWGSSDKWPVAESIRLWACAAERILNERDSLRTALTWIADQPCQGADKDYDCQNHPSNLCLTEYCLPCCAKVTLKAISCLRDDDKTTVLTEERLEAWKQAAEVA